MDLSFSSVCIGLLLAASMQVALSETNYIFVGLHEETCLVCPLNPSGHEGEWKRWNGTGETDLSKGGQLKTPLANVSLGCNASYYSLRLDNVEIDIKDGNYTCWSRRTLLASFFITVRATPTVNVIVRESVEHGKLTTTAYCRVFGAIPPFSITWFVGNNYPREEVIDSPAKRAINTTSTLQEYVKEPTNISCAVEGEYIENATSSSKTNPYQVEDQEKTEDHGTGNKGLYALVPALFAVSMCTSIYLYYRVKRHNGIAQVGGRTGPDLEHDVTSARVVKDTIVYDDLDEEGTPGKDATRESGQGSEEYETNLTACVKTSGMFEYWSATYKHRDTVKTTECFAKTLAGSATMTDAAAFQALARRLRSLEDHRSLLKLICISVDELPYSIFYEYMECGSLRDFMMRIYQEARRSHAFSGLGVRTMGNMKKQQAELLYFACSVAKGMQFICSQKFSHPAVSLKKVMISEDCECKLYDIHPTETAMRKVDELMKKEHPPIAWLAPETVFLHEYTEASDIWGFAVLMWELFSLGQVPCARRSKSQIEQQIRKGVVLPQPLCCPGAIYGLMLSSWTTNQQRRPTFDELVEKIDGMARKIREEMASPSSPRTLSEGNDDSYFILNPAYSTTDNYI